MTADMRQAACTVAVLLIGCLLVLAPFESIAQFVHLQGYVSDAYSRKPIVGATIFAGMGQQRKKITESGPEGRYQLEYAADGKSIIVEKAGYRTLVIPTLKQPAAPGDSPFFVPLPLIPLDQQATDKPYMQSQQQDYTLTTESKTPQKVIRIFSVQDAISGRAIHQATICLQYTRVEKKDCQEIMPSAPSPGVTFEEADIVSVVVESAGYQPYHGNLILDKMDGSRSRYEIKMTPEITLLTMNITNAPLQSQYLLVSTTGDTIAMRQEQEKSVFAFCAEGTYSLRVSTARGAPLHREVVQLSKGLNYRTLTLTPSPQSKPSPTPAPSAPKTTPLTPVAVDAVPLADTARRVTLYFIQSEYELQPEACQQLDRLVLLLRSAPSQNIEIEGHSDNVGNPTRNETLSEYRARKVYRYLQERGVAAERMAWRGKGGTEPKASNDSEENRKINRRVEIQIPPR